MVVLKECAGATNPPFPWTAGGLQAKVAFYLGGNYWKSSAHSGGPALGEHRWDPHGGRSRCVPPQGSEFQVCSIRGEGVGSPHLGTRFGVSAASG